MRNGSSGETCTEKRTGREAVEGARFKGAPTFEPSGNKSKGPAWKPAENIYAAAAILCIFQAALFFLPWLSAAYQDAFAEASYYSSLELIMRLEEWLRRYPLPSKIHLYSLLFIALCIASLLLTGAAVFCCLSRKRQGLFLCRLASLGTFFCYIAFWGGLQQYGKNLPVLADFSVRITNVPVLGAVFTSAILALSFLRIAAAERDKKVRV